MDDKRETNENSEKPKSERRPQPRHVPVEPAPTITLKIHDTPENVARAVLGLPRIPTPHDEPQGAN